MPHYTVVTHNEADRDRWPRISGKTDFQKLVTKYLNNGYTCVGGYNKEYLRVDRPDAEGMYILWSQALMHNEDNPPEGLEAPQADNGSVRGHRKTLRKRK